MQNMVEVRKSHAFDYGKLTAYLDQSKEYQAYVASCGGQQDASAGFTIKQFNHGQSNPTFLISYKGVKTVLRKKPPGKLLRGTHAVEREFKIQHALYEQGYPVPRQILLCLDRDVVGTEFYLMQFVDGRIFVDNHLPGLRPDERAQLYDEMVRVLASLHNFDYSKIGLEGYAKVGTNYYERQTKTWSMAYRATETETIPAMNKLIEWLPANIPREQQYTRTCIVHGDFRLDNVIFHPSEIKILAVLDWELSTLGNPMSDLASFCMPFHLPPSGEFPGLGHYDKDMSGIPTEFMVRDDYLKHTKAAYEISEKAWAFFLAQVVFKMTSIAQGVYKRSTMGTASSTKGPRFLRVAKFMASLGLRMSKGDFPYHIKLARVPMIGEPSEKFKQIRDKLCFFMERHVFGKAFIWERQLDKQNKFARIPPIMEELKAKAKEAGLWNLFLPSVSGLSQLEYAQLCELMWQSTLAPEVFNCSPPDTGNMKTIHLFGNEAQKKEWLEPLLEGKIRSFFGMSEPAVASSDATNIQTTITKTADGQHYIVHGRKWWVSGAGDPRCKIAIVLGFTKNPNKKRHQQHSMILVPMETPGVRVNRPITIFGNEDAPHGYMEVDFINVKVPAKNMLLGEGRGFEIAQVRIGPGRMHHCMRLIGYAERALMLMCTRAATRITFGKPTIQHQTVQFEIAKSRLEIEQARLLALKCADAIDKLGSKAARREIAMIKTVAPAMAIKVIDRAIQVYGGIGVSSDTSLAWFYAYARSLRLVDGPDEVHTEDVAKAELAEQFQLLGKL